MNTETQVKLGKIRKMSKIVRAFCKIGGGLLGIITLLLMILIIIGEKNSTVQFGNSPKISASQLTAGTKCLAIIFAAVVSAVVFKGIYHLHELFGNYAEGNIFTTESVAQIRQLGITLFLLAGVHYLLDPIMSILAGGWSANKAGLLLGLPVAELLLGLVIILISWVMDLGRELREENESVI